MDCGTFTVIRGIWIVGGLRWITMDREVWRVDRGGCGICDGGTGRIGGGSVNFSAEMRHERRNRITIYTERCKEGWMSADIVRLGDDVCGPEGMTMRGTQGCGPYRPKANELVVKLRTRAGGCLAEWR